MPKVSIIIPIYNVAEHLCRSLDSVCNQTLSDIEIILIDDCSTDNSLEIMEQYAQKDNRIKIIKLKNNSGAAIARNKGLDIATGEYLGFIDPDDEIDLNYYEVLYNTAKNENADVVKCKRKNIRLDGEVTYSHLNEKIKNRGKYFFSYEWTTAIYNTKFIHTNNIRFPEECIKAQDIVFLSRVVHKLKKLVINETVKYIYYKRDNSLNSAKIPLKSILSALIAQKLILEDINNSNLYETQKDLYFELYLNKILKIFRDILYQNDSQEAKKLCAEYLIKFIDMCKDTKYIKQIFPIKILLPLIESKNTEKIVQIISKYKSYNKIQKEEESLISKIFSVKNNADKKHKSIKLFGIKINIKIKRNH